MFSKPVEQARNGDSDNRTPRTCGPVGRTFHHSIKEGNELRLDSFLVVAESVGVRLCQAQNFLGYMTSFHEDFIHLEYIRLKMRRRWWENGWEDHSRLIVASSPHCIKIRLELAEQDSHPWICHRQLCL